MDMMEIGKRIRYYRRLNQMSQQQLALQTHLSRTSIQRLEAGEEGTSLGVLLKVGVVLGLRFELKR